MQIPLYLLNLRRLFLALIFLPGVAASSWAACVNTATPTCGVYQSCFADRCNCSGSQYEYFKSYGEKYCKAFLELPGLSDKGNKWRDSTLRCLQEKIVPMLPVDGAANSCNCKQMQIDVFDSHVACYTQPSSSICDLSVADWSKITAATDPIASLVDQKSRKQIKEVARICYNKVTGDVKDAIKKLLDKL
ncbi:hypothetical protein [Pseudorhodoferax sp. Leaf265]|uniref:hypothetical protein n=1 Tax=Pseudorhodoferax sp. Leaf265 TaxID=1736315 RepID=UPI0012E926F7|nr:hypothetical protein [Pseudorhodoferax sp. Leaf265]